jgi:hypothetical protein
MNEIKYYYRIILLYPLLFFLKKLKIQLNLSKNEKYIYLYLILEALKNIIN